MQPKFDATREDAELIEQILGRAKRMRARFELNPFDPLTLYMDLRAAHNSMPLKLHELLKAQDGDFAHDVFGIMRYIDRETGQLTDCFVPRYAV